jgi:hypothetical protein
MKWSNGYRIRLVLVEFAITTLLTQPGIGSDSKAVLPIADAGSPQYVAQEPVLLDGTASYDPDDSGPLSYAWRQISGPSVIITDANVATPTISGFVQTDEIQECRFELIVNDGELASLPDTVKVIIVPDFGENLARHANPPFDPTKPTLIYFAGGDCIIGFPGYPAQNPSLESRTNVIDFPNGYKPDNKSGADWHTYYGCGDMIIVYLSSVAPDYKMPIQTIGFSTGGQPAIDVGIRLNLTYQDARYAVNRVTLTDASTYCRGDKGYSESIAAFIASSVDGEQCWLDNYVTAEADFYPNVLNVGFDQVSHSLAIYWYDSSWTNAELNKFNNGVVAGAYWSVIGPGKNLQLASTSDTQIYKMKWYGSRSAGHMDFYDEPNHPGKLPEPVTLLGPVDVGYPNGTVLTCEESENAVGYQLLFGSDPHRIMDYNIISNTPIPPTNIITTLPFDETWWTVRVRDQYGSTIYADPKCINAHILSLPIENMTTGKRYGYIQNAVEEAAPGDEIVVMEGIYHENIDFQGKSLTVRSTDPNDSTVIAATILIGDGNNNQVIFSNNEDACCVLAGFTITDANNGIYCSGSSPTILNCIVAGNVSDGMKFYMGSNPTISNCIIAKNGGSGMAMFIFKSGRAVLINSPAINNCTIVYNSKTGVSEGMPTIVNSIIYGNGVQIIGSSAVVKYSDIQDGFPGDGNIDIDPLFADPDKGDYHLKSQAGRWEPVSQSWIVDDVTSSCIDAGELSTPVGLEPVPNGDIINMGAYGGTVEASKSL